MKKKPISLDDQKIWTSYTREMKDIYDKDLEPNNNKFIEEKTRTIDLHGFSLIDANIHVKKIIVDSLTEGYTKIKVIISIAVK